MKVNKDYIVGDHRIIEYDNGTIIKELVSQGTVKETTVEIPPSPLELIKKENEELKKQLENCQQSIAELTALAATTETSTK